MIPKTEAKIQKQSEPVRSRQAKRNVKESDANVPTVVYTGSIHVPLRDQTREQAWWSCRTQAGTGETDRDCMTP